MHKLSRKDALFTCFKIRSPYCRYIPSYTVLGSMVLELHDMRTVYLLRAITPAWVTNAVPFLLVIDYTRFCGSFEILQDKVNCHSSIRLARPVPRALNKHFSARGGLIFYVYY